MIVECVRRRCVRVVSTADRCPRTPVLASMVVEVDASRWDDRSRGHADDAWTVHPVQTREKENRK